ncbi:hypothetical protein SVIOM342S_03167 [Streptomyces violaceorubidus]
MGLPGTSVLAAAATYAGVQVHSCLSELRARMLPREGAGVIAQAAALDAAAVPLVSRILDAEGRAEVAEETLEAAERIMRRLAEAPPVSGVPAQDLRDDQLLGHDEAAALILGLRARRHRDRAAAWMEGDAAAPAMRLWRALARRCVGPYGEHAAAPLTLAGWVAWSTGDELEAREALAMALGADPDYLFARLLHQACQRGPRPRVDPPLPARGRGRRWRRGRRRRGRRRTRRRTVRGARPGPGGLTARQPEPHCFARPAAPRRPPPRAGTGPRAGQRGHASPHPFRCPPPWGRTGGPEAPAHLGDTGHGPEHGPEGDASGRGGYGGARESRRGRSP